MAFGISLFYMRSNTRKYTIIHIQYTYTHKCRSKREHRCILLSFTRITLSFLVFILKASERKIRSTEFSCMFSCNARACMLMFVCLCRCICVYNGCTAAFFRVVATAIAGFFSFGVIQRFKIAHRLLSEDIASLETNRKNRIKAT